MKEKALEKVSGTGKRIARRLKEFKREGVKPVRCLMHHLGCNKTEHFIYNKEKGTVKCLFEKKEGCFSPLPKKETEKKKAKKVNKEKTPPGKDESKEKKKRRSKKKRFTQMEFPIEKPPIDKPSEENKKDEHHGKHKHHTHHKGKPGGL